jgi:GTPase
MVVSSTYLNEIKGYKFYMAGYEKDNNKPGIDSLAFVKSVDVLKTLFKKEGVDLKQFKISSFKR